MRSTLSGLVVNMRARADMLPEIIIASIIVSRSSEGELGHVKYNKSKIAPACKATIKQRPFQRDLQLDGMVAATLNTCRPRYY